MLVQSLRFGAMEIDEKTVLYFKDGILGFEQLKRFVMVICDQTEPIRWLQAVEDKHVCLAIIDPFIIVNDYHGEIDDADQKELGAPEDIIAFCVMVIKDSLKNSTVNLCAPIAINASTGRAKQVLVDPDIEEVDPLKYPAYEPIKNYCEVNCDARTD